MAGTAEELCISFKVCSAVDSFVFNCPNFFAYPFRSRTVNGAALQAKSGTRLRNTIRNVMKEQSFLCVFDVLKLRRESILLHATSSQLGHIT